REPAAREPVLREPAAREPALREPLFASPRAAEPADHPSLLLADGVAIVDEAPPPRPRIWRTVDREPARGGDKRVTSASPPVAAPRARTPRARPLPWDPPLRSQPRRSPYDRGA
ncbi:MAG TPA: hypothetical protein VNZ05_01910, partial [Solirubrobacteraceae bacterium]|nr:hypothetical protein [Solirubrobacteraceae bacterium]